SRGVPPGLVPRVRVLLVGAASVIFFWRGFVDDLLYLILLVRRTKGCTSDVVLLLLQLLLELKILHVPLPQLFDRGSGANVDKSSPLYRSRQSTLGVHANQ
ncbi:unnamed protein product, partial [Laminaria digitata]